MWVSVNTTTEPAIWSDIMGNIFDAHDDKIKPKKRRNINTINRIINLLKDKNMNTREIHGALHKTWPRWCPGMSRLGNILSRCPEFITIGKATVAADDRSGSYQVVIWGLTDEARHDN